MKNEFKKNETKSIDQWTESNDNCNLLLINLNWYGILKKKMELEMFVIQKKSVNRKNSVRKVLVCKEACDWLQAKAIVNFSKRISTICTHHFFIPTENFAFSRVLKMVFKGIHSGLKSYQLHIGVEQRHLWGRKATCDSENYQQFDRSVCHQFGSSIFHWRGQPILFWFASLGDA